MKDAYRRLMEAPRIKKSTGVLSPHYCKLVNVIFIAAILKPITMVIWYNDAFFVQLLNYLVVLNIQTTETINTNWMPRYIESSQLNMH